MFYLNHFMQILFKVPVRSLFYMLCMFSLVFSVAHYKKLEEQIIKTLPHDQTNGHFYALVSNQENVDRVQRDMAKLPGVLRVEILTTEKINAEVQNVISSYQLDGEAVNLDVSGVKVIFDRSAKEQTKKITAEYLQRLIGVDKVTVGPIKNNDHKKEFSGLFLLVQNWGAIFVVAICLLLWQLFTLFLYWEIKDRAYLIAQFQRRTRVAFKIMLSGSMLLAFIFTAITFLLPTVNIVNLVLVNFIILIANFMFLRRLRWE